jgi:peptide/nickel transport system substrate-binding protein
MLALLGIALILVILVRSVREEPTNAPQTEEVPVAGGTYIEGILGFSETINPILAPPMVQANPVDQDLSALVFDGLTSLDETGQISPCLALSWTAAKDGTVYEFKLRPDVVWQDGVPFTAADVAFTVQAMQDPNYQGAPALSELWRNVTVEQLDSHGVRFTLQEPFPSFLYYTTIGILPAHLLSDVPAAELPADGFSTEQPVGTGRFMVESISPDRVVLVANPNYWGSKPFLERLETRFFGDWESLLQAYERDEIHGFHPPSLQDLPDLLQLPDLRFYSAQSTGYGIIYLNLKREPLPFFQQKEIRQALLYALDRQSLIDEALKGRGLIADSPISPITWVYDPAVRQYRYDPERAIGLLDASGWLDSDGDGIRDKEGVKLAFTLLTSDDPIMTQMAEEIVGQWRAVGVEVTIRSVSGEASTYFIRSRNFDAALTEIGLTADPDPYPLWHSTQAESGQNFSGFANEEADLVMEEGRLTADPKRSTELYNTFQQIFAEEVPSLLIYYPIYTYAVDAQVRQVQLSPLLRSSDRFRNIQDWYIQTEEAVVSENDKLDKTGE